MNRYEQDMYKDIGRLAKALEKLVKLGLLIREVKTKRYWAKRYGKLKNGIFMYYEIGERIKPRRVI